MPNLLTERRLIMRPQTFQALEQWFAADTNLTTSSGLADSIVSIGNGGRYQFSATSTARPTVAVDADGFTYLGFDGSTQRFATVTGEMRSFNIDPSGLEWHGVMAFSSNTAKYLMTVDPMGGEPRSNLRLYRPAANQIAVFPEGGSPNPSVSLTYGSSRAVFSCYRSPDGTTLAVGVNGVFSVSLVAPSATSWTRRVFNWFNPNGQFTNASFYEGLGFVATLTEGERQSVISYLRNKYRVA